MLRMLDALGCNKAAHSALIAIVLFAGLLACQTAKKVSFANDVAPILAQKCVQCHGQGSSMANLDLRTREGALKGGRQGPAIVPGDAAASHLHKHLTGEEQPQMPPGGR